MHLLIGLIGIGVVVLISLALNKEHRDATGVDAPSSKTMNRFYRIALERNISVDQAYNEWLVRKQKRERNRLARLGGQRSKALAPRRTRYRGATGPAS